MLEGATTAPVEADAEPAATGGNRLRILLAGVVLFLGASGLVYEYVLSTQATHLLGNSIEQFSVIIALMLFAMGVAGGVQRFVPDDRVADRFVHVEIALGVVGGASALLLHLSFATMVHFKVVLYGLALAIGFGIGTEIPLLMRWNARFGSSLRDNLSQVFSLDYVGALAGALVWAYLLLPLFPLDQISMILGLANLAVAGITLAAAWKHLRRPIAALAGLGLATVVLGSLFIASPRLKDYAQQRLFTHPIRHTAHSPYQDIVVTGIGSRLSLWLDGHLQLDSEDEFIYHELLVHPAMMAFEQGTGRPPERVLVLGGGDGCAVREVLRWPSVTEVLLVELDPAVTELARSYAPLVELNEHALSDARVEVGRAAGLSEGEPKTVRVPPASPIQRRTGETHVLAEVRVMHVDADVYLREAVGQGAWDVIIADFPDPRTPELAALYSASFYANARDALGAGGVLVTQASSPWSTRRAYWSIAASLEEAGFSTTAMYGQIPTFGVWGWHLARVGPAPRPAGAPPVPTAFLTEHTLATAQLLPPPMSRPDPAPGPSTRLAPTVYQLYREREPLRAPTFFPGPSKAR